MENEVFGRRCLGKHTKEKSTITTSLLFSAAIKSQYLEEGQAKALE